MRWGKTSPSDKLLEYVYEFAFKNNIKLNRLKKMFYIEHMDKIISFYFMERRAG